MRGTRIRVILTPTLTPLKRRQRLPTQRVTPQPDEYHALPVLRHTIVRRMQHPRRQHYISTTVRTSEITLYNLLHIPKAHKPLHVLRHEHLRTRQIYHLLHPIIQLPARLLRRLILPPRLPVMPPPRLKTQTLPRHREILTRKTARHNIHPFGKYPLPHLRPLHQVHHRLTPIRLRAPTKPAHIRRPRRICLRQYVIGEHRLHTRLPHQHPILINHPRHSPATLDKRLPWSYKTSLHPQIHTTAPRKQRQHAQRPLRTPYLLVVRHFTLTHQITSYLHFFPFWLAKL